MKSTGPGILLNEMYDQIISDLKSAELKLPFPADMPAGSFGRANSFSASALLARVYLTRYHAENNNQYAEAAATKADYVINSGAFSLLSDYAFLYEDAGSESIFQVVFSVQDRNVIAQYFFPRSLTGRYEVAPSESLIQSYEVADSLRISQQQLHMIQRESHMGINTRILPKALMPYLSSGLLKCTLSKPKRWLIQTAILPRSRIIST